MAVTANLTQSGSGAVVIHAQSGDTITLKLLNSNHDSQLAEAAKGLQLLTALTGITFTFTKGGGAS